VEDRIELPPSAADEAPPQASVDTEAYIRNPIAGQPTLTRIEALRAAGTLIATLEADERCPGKVYNGGGG
jgi:hypothetical protein